MATVSESSVNLRGIVQVPMEAYAIEDADEEVFLQYTSLAGHNFADSVDAFRGLGHLDSHKDTLAISFEFQSEDSGTDAGSAGTYSNRSRSSKRKNHRKAREIASTFDVELFQDKTALRTRKGDTGSVVWRASVDFGKKILQQHHSRDVRALLNPLLLPGSHILELGAGTGLLGMVFSSLVARFTATDIDALVPLIQKNLEHNLPRMSPSPPAAASKRHPAQKPSPIVAAEALDWTVVHAASPTLRRSICNFPPADLVLVVDCIYHPSLLPALLTTIDTLTVPGRTAVLVVVELRAEDVVREFLDRWLHMSDDGAWEIWSVPSFMERPYAVWVGWKADRDCGDTQML